MRFLKSIKWEIKQFYLNLREPFQRLILSFQINVHFHTIFFKWGHPNSGFILAYGIIQVWSFERYVNMLNSRYIRRIIRLSSAFWLK